jgi:hypothetical protein
LSLILLIIYDLLFIVLPRMRDVGMSAWWLLVMFIPVANVVFGIILLFRPPSLLVSPDPHEGDAPNSDRAGPLDHPAVAERPPSVV